MARWRRPVLIPGAAAHDLALVVDAGGDRLVGDPHAERADRAPVGVWAFDAAALAGAPRIAEADRLVLADDAGRLAVLFGEPERAAPTKAIGGSR